MFCKFLKLTNGENIIVTTDSNCLNFKDQKTITVVDPVVINTVKYAQGPYVIESYTMQPWIKLAKSDAIDIPTENVVIAVDVEDSVKEQYEKFLDDYEKGDPIPFEEEEFDEYVDIEDEEYLEDDEQPKTTKYKSTIH